MRNAEVEGNEFDAAAAIDPTKPENAEQPSLSDIDFNPQPKLMNNFFTNLNDEGFEAREISSGDKSSCDVNKAVIMNENGDSLAEGNGEEDKDTALGDLA